MIIKLVNSYSSCFSKEVTRDKVINASMDLQRYS
jgi:hypothetical protein